MASAMAGMSSVIVEPAAMYDPSPTVTGAMGFVLQPMKASSPIVQRNFLKPS